MADKHTYIPIVIVGAGPTGLLLAAELARFKVPFKIFDKKKQLTNTSNATRIQARTIEIFSEIGILKHFLDAGYKCKFLNLYTYGQLESQIDFNLLHSEFKYTLDLPQSQTERILNNYLETFNNHVERPFELINFIQKNNKIDLIFGNILNNEIKNIQCDWLIACDGVNSTILTKSKMKYTENRRSEKFIIADLELQTTFDAHTINIFLDSGNVLAIFPMQDDKFRVNASLDENDKEVLLNQSKLIKLIAQRTYNKAKGKNITFLSPYYIREKLIKNMRLNNILFAGDAAHTHSPFGGLGMNLGLQDAFNLAWKLAMVVNNKINPKFLDSYHLERYPIAKGVVKKSRLLTQLALLKNFILIDLRDFFTNLVNKRFFLNKEFSDRLSQVDTEYKKSPIIDYNEVMNIDSPYQGQHAPNVKIGFDKYLYDYLKELNYYILFITNYRISNKKQELMLKICEWLNNNYPNIIKTYIISNKKFENVNSIIDPDFLVAQRYHIDEMAIYLIRPDKYIAYCSNTLSQNKLKKFLNNKLYLTEQANATVLLS